MFKRKIGLMITQNKKKNILQYISIKDSQIEVIMDYNKTLNNIRQQNTGTKRCVKWKLLITEREMYGKLKLVMK